MFRRFPAYQGPKVAQLVIELPIEEADAALATLGGLPQPAAERWVAIGGSQCHFDQATREAAVRRT
jgi:hypothetical protein